MTAAHCVYDEALEKVRIARDMKVAVGKYRRAWNLVDKYEQRLDVSTPFVTTGVLVSLILFIFIRRHIFIACSGKGSDSAEGLQRQE